MLIYLLNGVGVVSNTITDSSVVLVTDISGSLEAID